MVNKKFCAEIAYDSLDGGVHSDLCWQCGPNAEAAPVTDEYRKLLHDCLDEWLNRSNGSGAFWVGDPEYFSSSEN